MAGVGTIISSADYNTIRSKVLSVMGTGAGSYGYGQVLNSSDVNPTEQITKVQWDDLRYDLLNAIIHQQGESPNIVSVQVSDPIKYGAAHPNYQYNSYADEIRTNRFLLGSGQSTISLPNIGTGTLGTQTTTSTWSNYVECTVEVRFGTADEARFFFNSGGKIRLASGRTGGSSTAQNSAWSSLLSNIGPQDFGATGTVNFYNLTSSYQTVYDSRLYSLTSGAYYNNYYTISAKCNLLAGDNSDGTATIVYLKVRWQDAYTDNYPNPSIPPYDLVDGTLTLVVSEILATGSLLPAGFGTFDIQGPSQYIVSSISGS